MQNTGAVLNEFFIWNFVPSENFRILLAFLIEYSILDYFRFQFFVSLRADSLLTISASDFISEISWEGYTP